MYTSTSQSTLTSETSTTEIIQSILPSSTTLPMSLLEEMSYLRDIDIVIPIKQESYVLRAVITQVVTFYQPRTIYIIAPNDAINTIGNLNARGKEHRTSDILINISLVIVLILFLFLKAPPKQVLCFFERYDIIYDIYFGTSFFDNINFFLF